MGIAWECFPLAGFRKVWWKTWLSAYWRPATSRDRHGEQLTEESQRRETRSARIREAKKALEERAREKAKSEDEDSKEAKPEPKAQYNFTDPESRIMKGSDGFVQGYNTQVAV